MVHRVKVLAAKPGDLSLIFGKQMMGEKTDSHKFLLTLFLTYTHSMANHSNTHTHTHTHKLK